MHSLKTITLSTLTAFTLFSSPLVADEREDGIIEVYFATLGRVPDAEGLAYWDDSSLSIEQITQSFFDQPETQAKYPQEMNDEDFVKELYRNVLGREGDNEGVAYWSDALKSGKIPKHLFVKALLDGAIGDDATMFQDKLKLSQAFLKTDLTQTDASMVFWTYGQKGYDAALADLNARADKALFLDQIEIDEPKMEEYLESSDLKEGEKNSVRSYFRVKGLAVVKDMITLIELEDYQGLSSSEQTDVLDVFRKNGGDLSKAKAEVTAIKKANAYVPPSGGGSTPSTGGTDTGGGLTGGGGGGF